MTQRSDHSRKLLHLLDKEAITLGRTDKAKKFRLGAVNGEEMRVFIQPSRCQVSVSDNRGAVFSFGAWRAPFTREIHLLSEEQRGFKVPYEETKILPPSSCPFRILILNFIFQDFIYLFLERGKGGRKRKKNINQLPLPHPQLGTWPATQACILTGNWTGNPLGSTQSTEAHQPGLNCFLRNKRLNETSALPLFVAQEIQTKKPISGGRS